MWKGVPFKVSRRLAFLIIVSFSSVSGGFAQSTEWKSYTHMSNEAFKSGDYDKAKIYCEKALVEAKKFGPRDLRVAINSGDLGAVLCKLGEYSKGHELLVQALDIVKEKAGVDNALYASGLRTLAHCMRDLGKDEQANLMLRQAIAILDHQKTGKDCLASCLNQLTTLDIESGNLKEADELVSKCLRLTEAGLVSQPEIKVQALNNRAQILQRLGKYTQAVELLQQVIASYPKPSRAHADSIGSAYNNLAICYENLNRLDKAELASRQAVSLAKMDAGPSSPGVLKATSNLCMILNRQGKYKEAKRLIEPALNAVSKDPEKNAMPFVALNREDAEALRQEGKFGEAEQRLKTAINLAEKLNAAKVIMAGLWCDFGLLYVTQERYSQSESCYKKALEIRQASLGEDHPQTAAALSDLAEVYRRHGKSQLAEEYFKRSIADMEKNPQDNKILLSATYKGYAELLRACGRADEALKMEAKARK